MHPLCQHTYSDDMYMTFATHVVDILSRSTLFGDTLVSKVNSPPLHDGCVESELDPRSSQAGCRTTEALQGRQQQQQQQDASSSISIVNCRRGHTCCWQLPTTT